MRRKSVRYPSRKIAVCLEREDATAHAASVWALEHLVKEIQTKYKNTDLRNWEQILYTYVQYIDCVSWQGLKISQDEEI